MRMKMLCVINNLRLIALGISQIKIQKIILVETHGIIKINYISFYMMWGVYIVSY